MRIPTMIFDSSNLPEPRVIAVQERYLSATYLAGDNLLKHCRQRLIRDSRLPARGMHNPSQDDFLGSGLDC